MPSVILLSAFNAECHNAECRYVECCYAECRGALRLTQFKLALGKYRAYNLKHFIVVIKIIMQ
jgi:hypothetical protein